MPIDDSAKLLELVAASDDRLDWYSIGRFHLHEFEGPATFDQAVLKLKELKLIEERDVVDGELPKLFLTDQGRVAAKAAAEERPSDAQSGGR